MRALSRLRAPGDVSQHGGPRTHRAIAIATCCARPGGGGTLRCERAPTPCARYQLPSDWPRASALSEYMHCSRTMPADYAHGCSAVSNEQCGSLEAFRPPTAAASPRGCRTHNQLYRYPDPGCTHSRCIHNKAGMRKRKTVACTVGTRARCEEARTSAEEGENIGKSKPRSPPRCCELLQTPSGAPEASQISTVLS
jgi:hypothetical protein